MWVSRSRVVHVTFFKTAYWMSGQNDESARAAEASPEMRRELLRQYLLKYPSSD